MKKQANHNGKTGVRVYLDHAAATPLDERVRRAMEPYWSEVFGNPGSLHAEGVAAYEALERARADCAKAIDAHPDEIIFTSGGTEGNNLALRGVVDQLLEEYEVHELHIVTSTIEHASVRCVFEYYEARGVNVTYVPVDEEGNINEVVLRESITENTVLVSVMYANNEFGTIQPIADIGRMLLARKKDRTSHKPLYFHTDASQAALFLNCDVRTLHVDLMTLDGQKLYGPKGVGVLFKRRDVVLQSTSCGGSHERGIRAGTPNVPLIIGMATALAYAVDGRATLNEQVTKLRDECIALLLREIPGAVLNGSRTNRFADNINISIPGEDAEFLVLGLDAKGIACSTQSACHERAGEKRKSVLRALGKDEAVVGSAIRVSIGKHTTSDDLRRFVETLKEVLGR